MGAFKNFALLWGSNTCNGCRCGSKCEERGPRGEGSTPVNQGAPVTVNFMRFKMRARKSDRRMGTNDRRVATADLSGAVAEAGAAPHVQVPARHPRGGIVTHASAVTSEGITFHSVKRIR